MKSRDVHVAVSGFAGLNNPHPGIGVTHALREGWDGPLEIHALGYDPLMTGAWMPGAAEHLHVLAPLNGDDEVALGRLLEIHRRYRLDAFIPCLDLELPVYARLAGRLAREGIKTLLPRPERIYATTKLRLPLFAYENDIRTPKTIHVLDMMDVRLHAEQFGFPLMVKGTVTGAKRVTSVAEAYLEAKKLNEKWGGGVLFQEPLAGEEFVVGAVVAGSGSVPGLVAMRKLGLNPDGKGVFGSVIDDPEIEQEAERILSALNWQGPLELEFIRLHGSKRLYLLEINCRFPSWVALSGFAGCNLPAMLLREILEPGRQGDTRPRPGTTFVRNVRETAIPMESLMRLERFGSAPGTAPEPQRPRRPADDPGLRVAVTGLGTSDVVNPGLGVAQALHAAPEVARIYGLAYAPFDSGLYRRDIFDAVFRLPQQDDPRALLERLRAIHQEAPFDVILPCMDGEIPRFHKIRAELEGMGVRTLLPSPDAFERRSKTNLFTGDIDRQWPGFEIPKTLRARSEAEVAHAVGELGVPVVIKGPVSEAVPVESAEMAGAAWYRLREKGITEVLVQQMIEGDHFAVAAVADRGGEVRALLTIKKLLKCDRGSTWSAVNTPQPALEAGFAELLAHIGWCGPAEGEFIRDERRERFFLIEVNPRFTAWISFSAALGINHPYLAAALAVDRPYEPPPVTSEMVFVRGCVELPVSTTDFARISTKGSVQHG